MNKFLLLALIILTNIFAQDKFEKIAKPIVDEGKNAIPF